MHLLILDTSELHFLHRLVAVYIYFKVQVWRMVV